MPKQSVSNRAGGDITENIDAEQESDSESSGFALSVDLSACVGTPALCRVWVRRRAKKVQWLANRIRRVAKFRGALLLLAGEHLLPPSEPLRMLRPDDTLRVARVEHEWQHAFSFEDSDEDAPIPTISPPQANAVEHNSPIKSTKESRKPKIVTQTSSPSYKRKFTVGDTLFLLSQTAEEHQGHTEPVIEHSLESNERNNKTSEVACVAQKSIAMEEPGYNVVDHDALNRVKRRALALLEEVAEEKDADVVDAPKKKRRRVRRRRPAKLDNADQSIQKMDDSIENQYQTPRTNHLDLTKEQDDSDSASKERLLRLISPNKQDCSKEVHDIELNNFDLKEARPLQSLDTCPTNPSAQSSPTCVIDYTELPQETQVPVLVRNCALPRAPRVVRALGSEIPGREICLE